MGGPEGIGGPILVTGATGFLGRAAVAALAAAGRPVIALGRSGRAVAGAEQSIACDLLDPLAMRRAIARAVGEAGAGQLLHLAWADDPRDRWHAPANLDWAAATLGLVRAFAAAGGRHAVLAGSCAEYDWQAGPRLAETAPLRPASLYGQAKAATGTLLLAAAPQLGIGIAWARIFFCYGAGEPPGRLLSDLAAGIAAGRPVPCTDGRQERDYLSSDEIGRALALIAETGAGGAINVASGRAVPVGDIVRTAARLLGRPDLPQLGAIPRSPGDPPRIEADVTRLAALGFSPATDLEAGLARAFGLPAADAGAGAADGPAPAPGPGTRA